MPLQNRLAERRLRLGLTQSQLAERAQVARQTISGIESGAFGPSLEVGFKLARALNARIDELFSLPEPVADVGEPAQLRAVRSRIGGRPVQRSLAGGQIALPAAHRVGAGERAAELFSGEALFLAGCDPALGLLGAHARRRRPGLETIWWPIGNGAALAQLEAGQAHAALVHAPDGAAAAPAPKLPARRLRLAARPIGLMVASGNPKGIRTVHDLARPGVRLINREPGSGARSLLDERLAAADVKAERLAGYARVLAG
ncbi:MAG TPA: substrate-binding domain-containing protein, partial [Limnochordia bacterium]|nr:substrate-binding domain-containing protein [Limnochordia bacterium]